MINEIDQYAVIGNPIGHSKSPFIHQQFALQTGENICYQAILVPLKEFAATVKKFQMEGGKGVNVTLPFKYEAYLLADEHSKAAKLAESANTLIFRDDFSIFADNTDGIGLLNDLTKNLKIQLTGKKILILGAGGATSGIIAPLLEHQPELLFIANRTLSKAIALVNRFQSLGNLQACELNKIPPGPFDFVINATSLSLTEERFSLPNINKLIAEGTICYDLAYSKDNNLTSFLRWSKDQGAKQYFDGLGMLVEQAAAAFYLWRGVYPHTKPVIAMLRSSF